MRTPGSARKQQRTRAVRGSVQEVFVAALMCHVCLCFRTIAYTLFFYSLAEIALTVTSVESIGQRSE